MGSAAPVEWVPATRAAWVAIPATGDATLKFSVLTGVAAMIETMPLEDAPDACAKMMAGKGRLLMVLTMQ